jgi:hypothetical protein
MTLAATALSLFVETLAGFEGSIPPPHLVAEEAKTQNCRMRYPGPHSPLGQNQDKIPDSNSTINQTCGMLSVGV